MKHEFDIKSDFSPEGDQPAAIDALCAGLDRGETFQVLEGVTGSGKTFTMANVIQHWGRPTLVISHNKTLAAQLYGELKDFFPNNAVEYFVSYYDYYQPEAYIPQTDTYIEKDASINETIERLRLSATNSLLGRQDVIIVASVSCIYGLGSPEDYSEMLVSASPGEIMDRDLMLRKLVDIQYTRNDYENSPGTFRVRGDAVDIFPSYSERGVRIEFFGDEVEHIYMIDPVTGQTEETLSRAIISPAKHFVMPEEKIAPAIERILDELKSHVSWLEKNGKLLEAQRLQQRTMRHLSGRAAGEAPATLIDYFPGEFLTIVDESHVSLSQIRGMFNGDQARKQTLIEHGFRLPSAKDNRPLNFEEFLGKVGNILCTTATPGPYELAREPNPVKQVLRPTGLLDPEVEVRPLKNQIDDLMEEVRAVAERGDRILVTTLTKRMAEDLSDYLSEAGLRAEYLHSGIDAIERVEVLRRLRRKEFDCLIGINLLREGLDLPEVALVAILDADKEGFLRSERSLIQIAGRTARHVEGRVILYGDKMTDAMRSMLKITSERRAVQEAYNTANGITPRSVVRRIDESLVGAPPEDSAADRMVARESGEDFDVQEVIRDLERDMLEAAQRLEFERAAMLRDEIDELRVASGQTSTQKIKSGKVSGRYDGKVRPHRTTKHIRQRLHNSEKDAK
jgi:excinuclease ABC subunit B